MEGGVLRICLTFFFCIQKQFQMQRLQFKFNAQVMQIGDLFSHDIHVGYVIEQIFLTKYIILIQTYLKYSWIDREKKSLSIQLKFYQLSSCTYTVKLVTCKSTLNV